MPCPVALYHESVESLRLVPLFVDKHGFKCRKVTKCAADIVLSQERGKTSCSLAFILTKCGELPKRSSSSAAFYDRVKQCKRSFPRTYVLIMADGTSIELLEDMQTEMMSYVPNVVFYMTSLNPHCLVDLMLHLRAQHVVEKEEACKQAILELQQHVYSPEFALDIATSNFYFLTRDECLVLLDVYGSFANLSKCTVEQLLQDTILGQEEAEKLVQFFQHDYICEM